MIVTVTANPAIDKRLIIAGFRTGTVNRAAVERVDIGGKGINVAQNLAQLDCDVIATGLLGAVGARDLGATLGARRIRQDFVCVPGEIRTNVKICDPAAGLETEINESGAAVPPAALEALTAKLRVLARQCAVMVFSGSLPPDAPVDLYARWIRLVSAAGVKTVLDTGGVALARGIAAAPDLVKPNRVEAEDLLHVVIHDEHELAAAGRRLLQYGAGTAVISLGAGGALSTSRDGMWRSRAPAIAARNTVGAGDAMVAALAYALERSLPAAEALRLATALGSAAAASATPWPELGRMEALLPHVAVESRATARASTSFPETGA